MMDFFITLRVRYAETDGMRVAYHGNYFTWFEVARTELIRHLGYSYKRIEQEGVFMPVIDARCQFLKPVQYDEEIRVYARIAKLEGVRVDIEYEIFRGSELSAKGFTIHAFMNREGKAIRPPTEFFASLKPDFKGTL